MRLSTCFRVVSELIDGTQLAGWLLLASFSNRSWVAHIKQAYKFEYRIFRNSEGIIMSNIALVVTGFIDFTNLNIEGLTVTNSLLASVLGALD